ncbi:general secretion pathway protein GspB [Duganella aceris]|uniref:General secretion pathway protein GspB n=1 Tax=Duganella aceris TaxID=2703883 RepID=A0ABX0FJ89_9BURK|nr:general secretion pathway protein GspB [Duganella aceris]NGZ84605.1 general secretion pathway protein GspB [Duganella aceris]
MDSAVNRVLIAVLLALPPLAQAQLADPTRPPAAFSSPQQLGADGEASGPRLQSILIGRTPGGRRVAVIDGVTLREGGKVGGAVLTRINETSVVLRRGKNLETLTLFPVPAKAAEPTGKP